MRRAITAQAWLVLSRIAYRIGCIRAGNRFTKYYWTIRKNQ